MINKINTEVIKLLNKIHSSYAGVTGNDYNTIFTFNTYSGDLTTDEFGNPILADATVITLKAKSIANTTDYLTSDIAKDFVKNVYESWFTLPLTYQGEIPKVLETQLLINNIWIKGKYYVMQDNISNLLENSEIRKSLGYHIKGTFEQEGTQRA